MGRRLLGYYRGEILAFGVAVGVLFVALLGWRMRRKRRTSL